MTARVQAIIIAMVLSVSPVALADSYMNRGDTLENFELIQQHTVYAEFIWEHPDEIPNIYKKPFAAIVGAAHVCPIELDTIHNAVRWFNDQLLFGNDGPSYLDPGPSMGKRNATHEFKGAECIVPDGFVAAISGSGYRQTDPLEELFAKDNQCMGCIFAYDNSTDESYYVTDPNGYNWITDRYRYNTTTNGPKTKLMYITHMQVDSSTEWPLRDEAPWRWRDTGDIRDGAPRYERTDADGNQVDENHACRTAASCAIEYTFMLAVNITTTSRTTHQAGSSTESKAGNSHPHNPTSAENRTQSCPVDEWGKRLRPEDHACSTGIQPNGTRESPGHRHETQSFDLFITNGAPYHLLQNAYWTDTGQPPFPANDETCDSGSRGSNPALSVRRFLICDTVIDSGFHLHDGSQTIDET